ncbi:DUF4326 domain-containing protein [Sphingomonas sp. R-74633]|nr:DUF4326 domain-containing protein [Sphingomonas sp. R-74633]NYT42290.1 DUF4326 domain-containing protein [Sphingomonas sp. R-74633]
MPPAPSLAVGSEGRIAPPINAVPRRLHRTRKRNAYTPMGAVYVGRPTLWGNPFSDRNRIGHARSVILYRSWLEGDMTPRVLLAAGFSDAEIDALRRWRERVLSRLPALAGRNLQCWCTPTSAWCHADVLLSLANARPPIPLAAPPPAR